MNRLVNPSLVLVLVTTCFFADASGENCYLHHGVSAAAQVQAVNLHNHYRSIVAQGQEQRGKPGPQPAALNMNAVHWDEKLAAIAQRWADNCTFEHDTYEDRETDEFFIVGQNIGINFSPSETALDDQEIRDSAIKHWYDEVVNFDSRTVSAMKFSYVTGHYTQVVYSDTVAIGCGYSFYKSGDYYYGLFVCNYGEGGNYEDWPVYNPVNGTSKPCDECTGRCIDALCYPKN